MRHLVGALLLAALLVPAIAGAQSTVPAEQAPARQSIRGTDPKAPVLFLADEVQYDDELGLVVAKGNVEIAQGKRVLLADTVTYNQRTDTITASGNVSLHESTGDILFADFVELRDELQEGFVRDIRVLMADRSRMAANTARRTGGVRTEMRRAVYSPCELCMEDPTRPPIWQIKAERVIHDQEKKLVEYHDAVLELGGLPVLYVPYFSHPDPTVKRESGLLAPTFGSSSDLGFTAMVPYYWVIGPDKDATFSPLFTSAEGVVLAGEYRQRLSFGEFETRASATQASRPVGATGEEEKDAFRGHLFARGRFDLDETWRTGFDVRRTTDQTYLRRYHFGGTESFLTSRAFVEGFAPRSFWDVNAYAFQPLREELTAGEQPVIAPIAGYNWIREPDAWGGRLSLNANVLNLLREGGPEMQRASLGGEWQLPWIGPIGDVWTFTAGLRGDAYYVEEFSPTAGAAQEDGPEGRIFPQVALSWRYPLVRHGESWSQFVEPIVAYVAAPDDNNPRGIPNEDSPGFEFDESDLFVRNRFPGYDRVDVGQRVDFGFRLGFYGDAGTMRLIAGQSYRLSGENIFPRGSGVDERLSDYVGRLVLSPGDYLDLVYRFRFDKDDFAPRRQELGFVTGPPRFRVGLNYVLIDPDETDVFPERREQISASVTAGISRYWTVQLAGTRDFSEFEETLSSSVAAVYADECLVFAASLTQTGTRDRDIEPGTRLLFSVVFRNLGEVKVPIVEAGSRNP